MNIVDVTARLRLGEALSVELRRNPNSLSEWLIWVIEPTGKRFLLADGENHLVKSLDANHLFLILKDIGFSEVSTMLL